MVGMIPDASGWQKPDIIMAKRIAEYPQALRDSQKRKTSRVFDKTTSLFSDLGNKATAALRLVKTSVFLMLFC